MDHSARLAGGVACLITTVNGSHIVRDATHFVQAAATTSATLDPKLGEGLPSHSLRSGTVVVPCGLSRTRAHPPALRAGASVSWPQRGDFASLDVPAEQVLPERVVVAAGINISQQPSSLCRSPPSLPYQSEQYCNRRSEKQGRLGKVDRRRMGLA